MMKKTIRSAISVFMTAALLISMPITSAAYDDFDAITNHVNLAVPQTLNIARPSGNVTTSTAYYYITGSSNPNQPLYMNGHLIETRGKLGSFGVYVSLAYGGNSVKFTQGDKSQSVIITRSDAAATVTTTTVATQLFPSFDNAFYAGQTVEISCVAPAGATVYATVNGQSVALSQVAVAQQGVPARFKGNYVMPEASGTVSLGNIKYTMTYGGAVTEYTSAGKLYTVGSSGTLLVMSTQVSAATVNDNGSKYLATAKLGAIDRVVDSNGTKYKLSAGGWISRENVTPIAGAYSVVNNIKSYSFEQQSGGEVYRLAGGTHPLATCVQTSEKLSVTLQNTYNVPAMSAEQSKLFSSIKVTQQADSTLIEFILKPSAVLWGYVVEYNDGITNIYCKYKPSLSGNASRPLEGITVVLDSGHGSKDPGALGVTQLTGPTESEINRATAIAVKKRLESLGATAILPDELDLNSRFNERMQPAIDYKADFFISLHCNSTVLNANGLLPNGVEIYYYETQSAPFANSLQSKMVAYTGRNNRGVKGNAFRVTLNSLAPSVLMEMGFMPNPYDYDDLCSKEGIYRTANAVGDAVIAHLS